MTPLLSPGQTVRTESGAIGRVETFLGVDEGGEVYRALLGGTPTALTWCFPARVEADAGLRERLQERIRLGPPGKRFLWPTALAFAQGVSAFGYVTPLPEPRFHSLPELLQGAVNLDFPALATAGFELARSFGRLQERGLCFHAVDPAAFFFDPATGEVCIGASIHIDVAGGQVLPDAPRGFLAPEIVRGEAAPSAATDRFSLAVLLFHLFHLCHPLQGSRMRRERGSLDEAAQRRLFGTEPVFLFDPADRSNQAVPPDQDPIGDAGGNALLFWPIYPTFLRDLFTRSFTLGLCDPGVRLSPDVWQDALIRLCDAILGCRHCRAANFWDPDRWSGGTSFACHACGSEIPQPLSLVLRGNAVPLTDATRLYPHHVVPGRRFDFSRLVAEVAGHPSDPRIQGLKNLSGQAWKRIRADGEEAPVAPGRSVTLAAGTKIDFGGIVGEIRSDNSITGDALSHNKRQDGRAATAP